MIANTIYYSLPFLASSVCNLNLLFTSFECMNITVNMIMSDDQCPPEMEGVSFNSGSAYSSSGAELARTMAGAEFFLCQIHLPK